jgi:CDGSH-type Zn-finger protein
MCGSPESMILLENLNPVITASDLKRSTAMVKRRIGSFVDRTHKRVHFPNSQTTIALKFWKELDNSRQLKTSTLLKVGGQNAMVTYYTNAMSTDRTEGSHNGFIASYDGRISMLYCTCGDYHFRSYYALYRNGLAPDFDAIPSKIIGNSYGSHKKAGDRATKTNPFGQIFLCKHLYQAIVQLVPSGGGV